jgi:hypothetical protein
MWLFLESRAQATPLGVFVGNSGGVIIQFAQDRAGLHVGGCLSRWIGNEVYSLVGAHSELWAFTPSCSSRRIPFSMYIAHRTIAWLFLNVKHIKSIFTLPKTQKPQGAKSGENSGYVACNSRLPPYNELSIGCHEGLLCQNAISLSPEVFNNCCSSVLHCRRENAGVEIASVKMNPFRENFNKEKHRAETGKQSPSISGCVSFASTEFTPRRAEAVVNRRS